MNEFQLLKWDSELFGFKVANILISTPTLEEFERIFENLKKQQIRLAYWQTSPKFKFQDEIAKKCSGLLVDLKTTFSKELSDRKEITTEIDDSIVLFSDTIVNKQMIELSLQCGEYSRFRVDPNVPYPIFDKLYTLWIEKSVSKELADDILIYKKENTIAGLATVYTNESIGHIGLIGVDKHYRGMGIGNKLIAAAINYFNKAECNSIEVVTQGKNIAACALYEKNGFYIKSQTNYYHFWNN